MQESTYEDGNKSGYSAQARDTARSGATQLAAQPSTVAAAQQPQQQCQHSHLQHQPQPDTMPSQLAEAPVVEAAAGPLSSITCSDHPPADLSHSSAAQAAPRASGYQEQLASTGMPTSSHARQQLVAMPVSSSDALMQDISHSQHDCRQIGAATRTQHDRFAEQPASPPQSQQNMAASNVYHTQGAISHQKEAFQQSPIENSQAKNHVDSNQNQQPAQQGPVQRTHQGSVNVAQPEHVYLENLSWEDRLSREKGLDMLQQGSPMSWVAFASELDTKQGSPCRWCKHPIRFVYASLPLFSMRGACPTQCLAPLFNAFVAFTSVLTDIHTQIYTHEIRVGKLLHHGSESLFWCTFEGL